MHCMWTKGTLTWTLYIASESKTCGKIQRFRIFQPTHGSIGSEIRLIMRPAVGTALPTSAGRIVVHLISADSAIGFNLDKLLVGRAHLGLHVSAGGETKITNNDCKRDAAVGFTTNCRSLEDGRQAAMLTPFPPPPRPWIGSIGRKCFRPCLFYNRHKVNF